MINFETIKKREELVIFALIIAISLLVTITFSAHAVYTQPTIKLYNGSVNISNVSVVVYGENDYGISLNLTEALEESEYTYVYDKDHLYPVTIAYENLIAIEWYELQNQSKRIKQLENRIEIICQKVKCDNP